MEQHLALINDILSKTPNATVFELGICDGYHTSLLRKFCTQGCRYFGFEPDPRNVRGIYLRGIPEDIYFFPDAVGRFTGPVPLHLATLDENGLAGSSSLSEFMPDLTKSFPWLKCEGTEIVWGWRLDDVCRKHAVDRIDFMWMDVQGGEQGVFDGAEKMLPYIRYIWTEYDGGTMYKESSTLDDIKRRLPGWEVVIDVGGDVLLKNPRDYIFQST